MCVCMCLLYDGSKDACQNETDAWWKCDRILSAIPNLAASLTKFHVLFYSTFYQDGCDGKIDKIRRTVKVYRAAEWEQVWLILIP